MNQAGCSSSRHGGKFQVSNKKCFPSGYAVINVNLDWCVMEATARRRTATDTIIDRNYMCIESTLLVRKVSWYDCTRSWSNRRQDG